MPKGKGTYGSKKGRPPKKGKKSMGTKKKPSRVAKKGLPKRGQRTTTNKRTRR